jgi:hypothetical protein
VLVFTHHPPYTNALWRTDDERVQADLLPAFFRSRKTVALLSGHVHGYERFAERGKTFVVSGGAGGPRVGFRVGPDARHLAAYTHEGAGPSPPHYIVIDATARGLRVVVHCLASAEGCNDAVIERFELAWPH